MSTQGWVMICRNVAHVIIQEKALNMQHRSFLWVFLYLEGNFWWWTLWLNEAVIKNIGYIKVVPTHANFWTPHIPYDRELTVHTFTTRNEHEYCTQTASAYTNHRKALHFKKKNYSTILSIEAVVTQVLTFISDEFEVLKKMYRK